MSLATGIVSSILFATAKHVAKSWLSEDWLDELADELLDLGKSLLGKQDKPTHNIAKQIFGDLQPIYEHSSIEKNSKQAVALEIARTLAVAPVTPELLIDLQLDKTKLLSCLREINPDAQKQFSVDETALYDRLLKQAAETLIPITTELEGFEALYRGRILAQQDVVMNLLSNIWNAPNEKAVAFENKYRRHVAKNLDEMELFGIPQRDKLAQKQRLSVAYVSLDVDASQFERLDRLQKRKTENLVTYFNEVDKEFRNRPDTLGINFLLTRTRRLMIEGQPGSGKSTLMQWLAVRAGFKDFPDELTSWNNCVPFFVRLRECVDSGFPAPEEFPKQQAKMIAGDMPAGWVHDLLEQGRALVLIDGIDEMPKKQRPAMLEAMVDLVNAYPLSRYIVTSRPAAVKSDLWPEWQEWLSEERFLSTSLRPLNSQQVSYLIEQWHDALAEGESSNEMKEFETLGGNLKRLLQRRPPLRRLATTPLLCAMICALHKERGQTLPSERRKLYSECVEMLLSRRDERRGVRSKEDYPDLTHSQALGLIQRFAYWLLDNGYSDVSIEQADNKFTRLLPSFNLSDVTGDQIRAFFVERAGLLREPVVQRLDFSHRTFQEYLAAQAVVEEDDIGKLTRMALDDQWRETIILAAGEARPKERERLLRNLIKKAKNLKRPKNRHQVFLLALACLETCTILDPAVRQFVIDETATVFPPQNEDEVRLIAAAGEPAIEHLEYNSNYPVEILAKSITALAGIGTQRALEAMILYQNDIRIRSTDSILKAWDQFDQKLFLEMVLGECTELTIFNEAYLEKIKTLPHLTKLSVYGGAISDLSFLQHLPQLTQLSIHGDYIDDLDSLKFLSQLGQFEFFSFTDSINDLYFLRHLPHLTELAFHSMVSDLSPLQHLTKLTHLQISLESASDLGPLQHLAHLTRLSVYGNLISDPAPLEQLQKLTQLTISVESTRNPNFLRHLTQLTHLNIYLGNARDLSPLQHLKHLTQLSIYGEGVSDLSPLQHLSKLKDLSINGKRINDLSPLQQLPHLTRLSVYGESLTDLSPLQHLSQLTELSISGKNIKNLNPLQHLSHLSKLDINIWETNFDLRPLQNLPLANLVIHANKIVDLSFLECLPQLQQLEIWADVITDLTPLQNLIQLKHLFLGCSFEIDEEGHIVAKSKRNLTGIKSLNPLAKLSELKILAVSSDVMPDISAFIEKEKISIYHGFELYRYIN